MEEKNPFDYGNAEKLLLKHIFKIFMIFEEQTPLSEEYFKLDKKLAILTITNAISDIKRSASYHSNTGPSDWKIAAFVGRWVAKQKPVQISSNIPSNLINDRIVRINSDFAACVTQSLLTKKMYPKLYDDLRYCFEFRNMEGDAICLLLQHSLCFSQKK